MTMMTMSTTVASPVSVRPDEDTMWRACVERDAGFDGLFVLAVRTTGIFCRPTCPARSPKRENVEFFPAPAAAIAAGYRACLRCRPLAADDAPPWVDELVARVERAPDSTVTDRDLRAMSIDPARARRWFRRRYGMTFHAYQRSCRLGAAMNELQAGEDLTMVGFRHGFASTSGFRDAFLRLFGSPPGRARHADSPPAAGLDPMMVRGIDTPVGSFIAGATRVGVCLFEFAEPHRLDQQTASLRARYRCAAVPGTNGHLDRLADEVAAYFDGRLTAFGAALDVRGTPFQERVWRRLQEIPYATTIGYAELARDLGQPGAARAVGRANGANRLAIVIPCHRVVRGDGTLGGYGGGLWRKQALLDHERTTRR